MRILLTGGAGFIGSHVLKAYLEVGHEVVVVDDLSGGRRENIPYHVPFYRVDVRDQEALEDLVHQVRPEVVNHHAALVSVRQTNLDPNRCILVNFQGTANLLRAAQSAGVRKFIYSSSGSAVYGNRTTFPIGENKSLAPISPYGQSKMTSENLLMGHDGTMEIVILRYGNVFGPGQDPAGDNGVISIFTYLLLKGKKPPIYGDGNQTRDFVYVQDVAKANRIVLRSGLSGVFNIASGMGHKVVEVYERIAGLIGTSRTPKYLKANPFEIQDVVLDVSRAETILGWKAEVDFDQGLSQTVMGMAARIGMADVSLPRGSLE